MWICTGNKLVKFHRNILSLSENIAKSFRGGLLFLTHTVHLQPRSESVLFSERLFSRRQAVPYCINDNDKKYLNSFIFGGLGRKVSERSG